MGQCTCGGVGECKACLRALAEENDKGRSEERETIERGEKDSQGGGYEPWTNWGPNQERPDTFGS